MHILFAWRLRTEVLACCYSQHMFLTKQNYRDVMMLIIKITMYQIVKREKKNSCLRITLTTQYTYYQERFDIGRRIDGRLVDWKIDTIGTLMLLWCMPITYLVQRPWHKQTWLWGRGEGGLFWLIIPEKTNLFFIILGQHAFSSLGTLYRPSNINILINTRRSLINSGLFSTYMVCLESIKQPPVGGPRLPPV